MKSLTIIVIALAISFCLSFDCGNGAPNDQPVIYNEPQLLQTVPNGEKYLIQNGTNYVYIIKVKGSPYEMGYAAGELMAEGINYDLKEMFQYIENNVIHNLIVDYTKFPPFLVKLLSRAGLSLAKALLDLNWYIAKPYTPKRYEQEMKGMAKSSGASYIEIRRLNMFPELTQAACSIVGAWNPATLNNKLIQLRALDWSSDAPINKYPTITVYHSTEEGSYPFANIGYAGFVASITAFSSQGIALSEKVWMPPKDENAHYTYFGKPWAFVFRDLAQFETNIEGALSTLQSTHRTMRIHIGFGSQNDQSFRGILYGHNNLTNFNDVNYTYYSDAHPQMNGVFFWDKHPQPSNSPCMGQVLQYNWGHITPETIYRDVIGYEKTGNTQVCVFDINEGVIYLSYSEFGTNIDAFKRSMIYVDLKPFWKPW